MRSSYGTVAAAFSQAQTRIISATAPEKSTLTSADEPDLLTAD